MSAFTGKREVLCFNFSGRDLHQLLKYTVTEDADEARALKTLAYGVENTNHGFNLMWRLELRRETIEKTLIVLREKGIVTRWAEELYNAFWFKR